MTRYETWLAWTAGVGVVAGVAAGVLIWALLTHPMAVARVLTGGF
ncbi:MAG: hypothetical protein R2752_00485 [Vicinamibacterales bacterium]